MSTRIPRKMPKSLTAVILLLLISFATTHAGSSAHDSQTAPTQVTGVSIAATKTDSLVDDVNNNTLVDPGDTLEYSIVVTNNGDEDALDTTFTDITDDAEVTVVAGSLRATPIGRNDAYSVIGNTQITHPAGTGLAANDLDPDGGALTASCTPCTTAEGATVSLSPDGSFSYTPPAGFTGTDTFTYTVTDPDGLTDTGTVTFTVTDLIWWVDSDAEAGDGRSTFPFNTISAAQTASGANDVVFVFNRGTNYTDGFVMDDGERLCGQGSNLQTCSGITPPAGTTFPAVTTNPTLTNAAGAGITLAQNNTIQGITVGSTTGFGIAGTAFGTLAAQNVTINTSNGGLSLTTGTANVTFNAITSTGGVNNINLSGVNGTLNLGSGALSGSTNHAFHVNGGTAVISYSGTISNSTADVVLIQNKTAGSVTLSGAVTSTGTGITLTNNTGATIHLIGSLALNTGTNEAFTATGGGTLNVTGTTNTVTTSTGTAVNIRNVIIGASGVTFRSVSANGGSNGIYLDGNTGGAITVSGTGGAGTGGTIQNMTGANATTSGTGVYLNNNSAPVSLNHMQLNGFSNFAIRGTTASNFTLANSVVSGTSGDSAADDEGAISFTNLTGTFTFTNNNISGGHEDNIRIINSSGTLNATVTGTTIRDTTAASPGNNGLLFQADGTANITANVTTSSFLRNRANGIQAITNDSGVMDITVGTLGVASSGGTFQDNNIGVNIAHNSSGTLNFDVQNATFQAVALTSGASPININLSALGNQMSGSLLNNVITNNNSLTGPGLRVIGNGAGTLTILIDGNNVSQVGNRGIEVIARDGSNTINATITNNTVTLTDPLSADGIRADAGATSGDTTTICANIDDNSSTTIAGLNGIRVRQRFTGTTYRLVGYGGSATDDAAVIAFLSGNNNGATALADHGGSGFQSAASCPTPPLAFSPQESGEEQVEQIDQSPEETTQEIALQADASASMLSVESVSSETAVAVTQHHTTTKLALTAVKPDYVLKSEAFTAFAPDAPQATTTFDPFTLPAGESTTITFRVMINDPFLAANNPICNQATISGSNFSDVLSDDPDVVGSSDSTCTTVNINADLAISKTDGLTTAVPGTAVTFTIVASNAGPHPDPAAVVTDNFPAAITGITWTCADAGGATCTAAGSGNINETVNLPVGGSVTFTASGTIDPAAISTLANTAAVAASTGITDPVPANNSATDTNTLTPEADLSISKTDSADPVDATTGFSYTLDVANNGPSTATSVSVEDTLPAGVGFVSASGTGWTCGEAAGVVTCTQPALAPGAAPAITINVTAPAEGGVLSNTAVVSSAVTDPGSGNDSDTETTTVTPVADLAITKSDSADPVNAGAAFSYTLDVTNSGPTTATSVTVGDTLPAGVGFVSASGTGWTCGEAAGVVTCTRPTLAPGAAPAITINVTASTEGGNLSNTAIVSAAENDPAAGNNSDTETTAVTAQADVSITKTDGQTTGIPGTGITYTIVASNAGPSSASSVTIADTFPAALTGVTWTCVGAGGGTCAAGSGNINDTANLPAGGSVTYTANATIAASATGTLSNTATAAVGGSVTDPTPGNNSATDTTTLTLQADLSITKTDGLTAALPGQPITYTITVSNAGPSTAVNATVADTFSADITGISWTCTSAGGASCTAAGSGDIADAVTLPPSSSLTYVIEATIDAGTSADTLVNIATVTAPGDVTDPDTDNNSSTDSTSLDAPPEITNLTTTPGTINENDTVDLSLTFTDPNTLETHEVIIDWGDGISETINLPLGTLTTAASHTYLDDNPTDTPSDDYTITVIVNEPDGGTDSDTAVTTDNNVAPSLSGISATDVSENGLTTLSGTISDPGTQDTFTLLVDWGDGSSETFDYGAGTAVFSETHTYEDDDPTGTPADLYTVTLTVTDDDTGSANDTTTLTVQNEAPLVDAGVNMSVVVSTTVAFNGSFTDVGTLDTHAIDWDFGDGVTASGTLTPSHTFTAEGVYTVTLTVTDDDTGVASDSLIVTVTDGSTQVYVYLPIVMVGSSTPPGPDLVVSSLTASGSDITVVVTNQGDTAVTDAFWVDVYIDPDPIPTMVNQTWAMLADQGLVWGVDNVTLNPGQSLTLTINGGHYQANLSNFSGNLLPGTPVYAQVDSANATTTFGAVLENHENSGGVYNNITGTTAQ